jgi:hypothetical protein
MPGAAIGLWLIIGGAVCAFISMESKRWWTGVAVWLILGAIAAMIAAGPT